MKGHINGILSFLLFIFVLNFPQQAPAEESKLIIKVGTLASEGTSWIIFWQKVARSIEKRVGGKVKIITYTGGVMGDEDEMLAKMRMGQLHVGGFTINGLRKIAPEIAVLDVPFVFQNYREIDFIIENFLPEFEKYFRKHGFELFLFVEQGFTYFFSTKELSGFRDIGKTKMWVWFGEDIAEKVARVLGAGIVFLSVPDVFPALEKGIIETIQTSPMACLSLQWCKLVRVMIDYPYRYEPAALVITKSFFDKLPQDVRDAIKEESKRFMWDFIREIRRGQKEHKERLRMLGVKHIKPSQEDLEWFTKEVKEKIWYSENAIYPHELLRKILRKLESFRNSYGKTGGDGEDSETK